MAAALSRTSNRSRALALLAVLALVWALTNAIGPHDAQGAQNVNVDRIAGNDRYETAAAIALRTFPSGAEVAVLARGDNFPDALAGNFVAGADPGSPILLTPHDSLHSAALNALKTLKTKTVIILGGESAVSKAVADALTSNGFQVSRIEGTDRYDTAAKAATQGGDIGELNGQKTAIVASGEDFADALAGGPIAYSEGFPTLLTQKDSLPEATRQQLVDLGIKHVLLLGGEARISAAVANQITALGITVERIFGLNRQSTAGNIAQFALDELGYSANRLILTRGDSPNGFADPLASGPFGGENLESIFLVQDPTHLGTDTDQALKARSNSTGEIDVIGGEQGVSNDVVNQAKQSSTCTPTSTTAPASSSTTSPSITSTISTLLPASTTTTTTGTATSTTTTTPTATSTTTSAPPKVCQPGPAPVNSTTTMVTGTSTTITGTATSTSTTMATTTTTT